ncbi:glutathione S-transferase [Lineolata rhizophorae]|uniref:Glutathione S-transferase n=1 Tax=Lineolata rhizophorae TaxID=578093 RepID=A0A6A6P6L2_9PEZI|nr:glutathione S-transferase [Lineolata rhizophorae]
MSSQLQPVKLWGHTHINPPKVAMILEELDVPYELIPVTFEEVKQPDFLAINPNGRLPAIHDPNTDMTLWESGAILEYLIEKYDAEHRLSFAPGTVESFQAKQWLFFQVSGQGPYYGQWGWFEMYHPEPVPSAKERYAKEIRRISGVLDTYLRQQKEKYGGNNGGPWLVGDKLSYADISFVMWQYLMMTRSQVLNEEEYPHLQEWMEKMTSRQKVKKVLEEAISALDAVARS